MGDQNSGGNDRNQDRGANNAGNGNTAGANQQQPDRTNPLDQQRQGQAGQQNDANRGNQAGQAGQPGQGSQANQADQSSRDTKQTDQNR